MSEINPSDSNIADPIHDLIATFLDAESNGQPLDREAWLARHSDHAVSLREFLANHDRMMRSAPMASEEVTLRPISHTHNDATSLPDVAGSVKSNAASVGDRLRYFGDYELLEEIARGGMGVVYKAKQLNLNRVVALKMILAGQLASDEDVQRFHTEAESAANLEHPRIVPIYEVGQHAGQHYFSMGFVDGKSLAQKLVDGPMAPREAAEMLLKICEGIAYAHDRGVIHRDLKPANILLDQNEQPRVTDFGLAKKLGSDSNLTGTGQILGTPSYMAPEQASGKVDEVGPLADIYALGAILYCLLTGRPPFQAANPMDTLLQVLDKDPIPPRQLNSTIPVDLETICLKCLNKEPHRRYADTNALLHELARFLRGEPIQARPTTPLERSLKWAKRRPAISGLSLAVLLVGTLGMVGIAWQWRIAVDAKQVAVEQQRIAEEERDVASRSLYVANMHLARQAWEAEEITYLQEVLQRCVPKKGMRDFRGWEWHFLSMQSRSVVSLVGHTRPISSLAWSPDGTRLASSAQEGSEKNGELKIWDAKTGKELFVLESLASYGISTVAWSSDGRRLASGGGQLSGFSNQTDGELRLWDTQTGKIYKSLNGHHGRVNSVAFSPDGQFLASAAGEFGPPGEAKIWDCESGKELLNLTGHENQVNSVSWSPDGKRLVTTAPHGTVKIWDAKTGVVLKSLQISQVSCQRAIWSPDGKKLATVSADQVHRVWDTETGNKLLEIPPRPDTPLSWAAGIEWLVDSQHLSWVNNDGSMTVWDLKANKASKSTTSNAHRIQVASLSPDRSRLALAGSDQKIKIADDNPTSETPVLASGGRITMSRDGKRLATIGEDIKIWELATGRLSQTWSWPSGWRVADASWSPDGKRMVASGAKSFPGAIKMWDCPTEKELYAWSGHIGPPFSLAWKPDGSCFATGGMDKLVKTWDASLATKEMEKLEGHRSLVTAVAWHPNENRLASASHDGTVRLWNLEDANKSLILEGHAGAVNTIDWSPSGNRIVSGGVDGVKVWDSQTGIQLMSLQGHTDQVGGVAWQPGVANRPQRVASISFDGTLKLWDVEAEQEVLTLYSRESPFLGVAWSPDGKHLLGSTTTGVRIWSSEVTSIEGDDP